MRRIRLMRASSCVAYFLIFALVIPLCLIRAQKAEAQSREGLRTVAVLPFRDMTPNRSRALGEIAADAVVLPLAESGEFEVIAKDDVEREREGLGLRRDLEPLSTQQLLRLGKRLGIDGIFVGQVVKYGVNLKRKAGAEAVARVNIAYFDIAYEEQLEGATAEWRIPPKPDYRGTGDELGGEAIRSAGEEAVRLMLASTMPPARILARDIHGRIRINLGAEDGVNVGDEFAVVRSDYIAPVEKLVERKISTIEIIETESRISHAKERGRQVQMGDRVVRIYKPLLDPETERKGRRKQKLLTYAISLALLIGVVGLAKGPDSSRAPTGSTAYLAQHSPGADPVIRLKIPRRAVPTAEHIWLYVVHRRENVAWFNPTADTIIDVEENPRIEFYDDDAVGRVIEFDSERTFMDTEGEEDTFSVSGTFNDYDLQPEVTYFYRLQMVTDPDFPPGTPPTEVDSEAAGARMAQAFGRTPGKGFGGLAGVGGLLFAQQVQFDDAELDVDRDDVMTEPSRPIGPVTYLQPPLLLTPPDGDQNQTTTEIRFTWHPSPGATEYRVDIFPDNDPGTFGNPVFQSPVIVSNARDRGADVVPFVLRNARLEQGRTYYWRVGSRRRGELSPVTDALPKSGPFLWSSIDSFTTAIAPPPTP